MTRSDPEPWGPEISPDLSLTWAKSTNYDYFADRGWQWLPFLVRLKAGTAQEISDRLDRLDKSGAVRIAPAYLAAARRGTLGKTLTLQIQESEFAKVLTDSAWDQTIEELEFSVPLPTPVTDTPFPGPAEDPPTNSPPQPPPNRIVVAVIDDSIPFANHRFRWPDGTTRFHSIWQQDGLAPHLVFSYGAEMSASGLNALLAQADSAKLSESEIYEIAGMEDYSKSAHKTLGRRTAHGAHVADLACGFVPDDAPQNEILIGVQLDQAAVQTIYPADLSVYIRDALEYIINRTEKIEEATGEKLPIVVNLSFGWYTGPHDGTSMLETAIDDLVKIRSAVTPMCIVLPAGNSRLERTHAHFVLQRQGSSKDEKRLDWRLQPDHRATSLMEVWLGRASDSVGCTLTGPGVAPVTVKAGESAPITYAGRNIGTIDYKTLQGAQQRRGIRIRLAPTAPRIALDSSIALAPSGLWTVDIANLASKRCYVDAWIGRSGRLPGWPVLGRQPYFDDLNYQRFTSDGKLADSDAGSRSYVRRKRTLNGVATGKVPVVAGGFRGSNLSSADYSSLSPFKEVTSGGTRTAPDPDVAARSDDSRVLHGVLAAGSRAGSVVAQNGTSVAAPQVTRWVANELMNVRPAGRHQVGALAALQELARPPLGKPGLAPFPGRNAVGKGRLVIDLNSLAWGRPTRR